MGLKTTFNVELFLINAMKKPFTSVPEKAFFESSLPSSDSRGRILSLRLNEAVRSLPVNASSPERGYLPSAWCSLVTFTYLSVLFV